VEAHFSLGISSTFDSVLVVSTIIKLLFFLLSLLPTFEGWHLMMRSSCFWLLPKKKIIDGSAPTLLFWLLSRVLCGSVPEENY
jgi:hypothetical protein